MAESERAVADNIATPDPRAKAAAQMGALDPSEAGSSGLGAGLEHAGRGVGVGDAQDKQQSAEGNAIPLFAKSKPENR